MSRFTENAEPIGPNWFENTDTDTDVGIWNTEKYRIPTIKYRKVGSVRYFISISPIMKKEQQQTK